MYILTDIMRFRLTENRLRQIIKEEINSIISSDLMDNVSFKEWFSQNGLVDENGQPLLVYHGSGKDISNGFDIESTYDGKHCFTPNKQEALIYTHWNNGDDNWRTINEAYEYLMNEGYELNTALGYPKYLNLLNMVNSETGEQIDEEYAYNIIRQFYQEQYSSPTLYYCFLRNAEVNEYYSGEYNVYDDNDVWVIKKEAINYRPIPEYPDMSLNTYIE